MATEYKKYLAEKVLNEKEPVTYRSLSRALNVHSNLSKQMLYEFHRHENSKKAKSVNATYIIIGVQREPEKVNANGTQSKDGEDDYMQSSPFMSSMPQQDEMESKPKVTSVTLAREEDLDSAKSRFETILSIHIHSLQPGRLHDLNILGEVGRDTLEAQLKEDPLGQNNKQGMIQNKKVKRRTGIKISAPPPAAQPEKGAKPAAGSKSSVKEEESSSQSSKKEAKDFFGSKSSDPKSTSRTETSTTKKPAQINREKSDLFKSFAKAKPKAKKAEPEATESAGGSTAEDAVLDDASEEEREDLFAGKASKGSDKLRQERLERAENLKRMMEDDEEEDEDMPDAPESPPEEEAPPEPTLEETRKSEPREEAEVQGGRRRGRRQVMKKKVVKDEDGYLVTREEPVWEEFSEEEKPPPKKKPAVSVKPPPKSSKGSGKPGQGNIMSFFSKK
ncbi:hypothetical protein FQN54_007967 [Arachnomyces sp. PD_36]|nr:hypothetical protein FQN54_007967 [Arachnomyces sp. PD_36]